MAQTFIFIRHGQSQHNANGNAFSGITNVQMNAIGRQQCSMLSKVFQALPVSKVFTSHLERARESARIIFPDQTNFTALNWLTEFNYGEYEGRRADDLPDDPVVQKWNTAPEDLTFPNGDSIREHAHHTYSAFLAFAQSLPQNSRVACVSHRTTIRLLVALVLKMDLNHFRNIPCSNCSITDIRLDETGNAYLHALNVSLEYTQPSATGD